MCGIAGILNYTRNDRSVERLRSALPCLQHRGPENEGLWSDERISLGHRRLAIIDLSAAASQPMIWQDRYVIIHNGELYNYPELRRELSQHVFRSSSDTEVIVASYAEWGTGCLQKFDGMFAFAIWDIQKKELFIARDRFGEKPVFFHNGNDGFTFASELKALWKMSIPKEVNPSMSYNFISYGYTLNPFDATETFYTDVSKLPAASFLKITKGQQPVIEKYWQTEPLNDNTRPTEDLVTECRRLLNASVKRRLRSDVKIGTSLSGGLDSAAIVSLCEKNHSDQNSHKCFTAGFEGFEKDETKWASQVATAFNLQHHIVRISDDEIADLMDKVMHQQDEPFSSASVLAQYKVYEAAKQEGVTVLLDGQGADELFAGYHQYFRWHWRDLYRQGKLNTSGALGQASANAVKETFSIADKLYARFPNFFGSLQQVGRSRAAAGNPDLDPDFRSAQRRASNYALPPHLSLNGILHHHAFSNGLEELLRLADRNSMAHSIEVRLPFLDHSLAEFAFSLPDDLKIRNGWTKWILRAAMTNALPEDITWRKDKIGFEPPQKRWMSQKKVADAIAEGKRLLVEKNILHPSVLKRHRPHTSYEAGAREWKYWSLSYLYK